MTLTTVGFVGLGTMGLPMAANVAKGGYRVLAVDQNAAAVAAAVAAGARAASLAEAAGGDAIITMLPDAPDVERVALGPDGIAAHGRPGLLHIDMSTIDPVTSRRVAAAHAERGIRMIDSPVARGPENARAGTLALMLGGDQADIDTAMPLLRCMADTITVCGGHGNGTAMKLFNNFLSAGIVSSIAEALTLGAAAGLSVDLMVEVSRGTGTNNAWLHKLLPAKQLRGDFSLGFRTRLALKDQRLALSLAQALGVNAPLGEAVRSILAETAARYPDEDFTSLIRVKEQQAGVTLRLKP